MVSLLTPHGSRQRSSFFPGKKTPSGVEHILALRPFNTCCRYLEEIVWVEFGGCNGEHGRTQRRALAEHS